MESSTSKSWLWRSKKSGEKPAENSSLPLKPEDEEIHNLMTEKEELENHLKFLKDKLDSVLIDSHAKDSVAMNHGKTAKDATEGRERAKARVKSMKQELDEALEQKAAVEKRLTELDAALKECMQQLRFVRDDQEKRIHDAVTRASMEFDESRMIFDEKLADMSKRLAKLGVENTRLSEALLAKDKVIRELNKQQAEIESALKALTVSLEFTEKDNASLKYEVRVLEKELEIRNEEREFSRRTADATHKQHLESVKKISELESECQRLRLLVRKRLPGPAALAKMRSEPEIVGRDSVETRRRRSIPGSNMIMSPTATVKFLTEQKLNVVEEENKILREALTKKESELQSSRSMFARAASRLSPVDTHMYESPRTRTSYVFSHDVSLSSVSEVGSDDKVSSVGSISEWEHTRYGKRSGLLSSKTFGAPDMDLMNDFVEMERLAIVSVDKQQPTSPQVSSNSSSAAANLFKGEVNGPVTGTEIVPVLDSRSTKSSEPENPKDSMNGKDWLHEILGLVLEQNRVSRRKSDEVLEEIRAALENAERTSPVKGADADSMKSKPVCRDILWKSTNKADTMEMNGVISDIDVPSVDASNQQCDSDMAKSVSKIIELLEGITMQNPAYSSTESWSRKDANSFPYKMTETTTGYTVRVFQWKTSELSAVLQQVLHTSYDMLSRKCNVNRFAQELTSALDWIMNHCFSLQDVSSMKEAIKKHLDWDSRSEGEAEVCIIGNQDEFEISTQDEATKLQGGLERRLMSATVKSETWTIQAEESEKTSARLPSELDNVEGYKVMMEDDLDTQLAMAKAELNEARQKLSSLEAELENRNSCCEELEDTCVDLQLQLESATDVVSPNHEVHRPEEKQLRTTNMEIAAASDKLAECQETILNLGKQIKALASPKEAVMLDNVIFEPGKPNATMSIVPKAKFEKANSTMSSASDGTPKAKLRTQRSTLLDRMVEEDNAKATGTGTGTGAAENVNAVTEPVEKMLAISGSQHQNKDDDDDDGVTVSSLALVPGSKRGVGGLWRKLLKTKKKSVGPKPPVVFAK
ncbi:Filament-like plant protein 7 [Linum grandiflorum]